VLQTETTDRWIRHLSPSDAQQPRLLLVDALWEDDSGEIRGAYFSLVRWPVDMARAVRPLPDRIVDVDEEDVEECGVVPLEALTLLRRWVERSAIVECEDVSKDMGAVDQACTLLGLPTIEWPLATSFLGEVVLTGAQRRRLG
jgi:hypothetical protein